MTANCIEITSADNMASNGVVHVIGDVITPVTSTILDLIQKNPELSTLKTGKELFKMKHMFPIVIILCHLGLRPRSNF